MGMAVEGGSQGSGSMSAEPNVVPMIDIMLVLLIIFMIVTPALAAGFQATPPEGVNLKSHPEDDERDQVLGIDAQGKYYLNKRPIKNETLAQQLRNIFEARTEDKILYVKADRNLEYSKVQEAIDIAAHNGVRVVGAITEQEKGTKSTVPGDIPNEKTGTTP